MVVGLPRENAARTILRRVCRHGRQIYRSNLAL